MVLVVPVQPVMEGEAVTLHCMNKITSNVTADFYKDGVFIGRSAAESMTIHTVYKSDEGLYKCVISGAGQSTERRLTVRGERKCKRGFKNVLVLLIFNLLSLQRFQ